MNLEISNIINGWGNFIFENEVSENLAQKRATKCADCPHNKRGLIKIFDGKIKEIDGNYCELCTCPLVVSVRSKNKKCPINLW